MVIYPNLTIDTIQENLSIQAFGKRIYEGQTFFEFFLEFLLVFISDKEFNHAQYACGFPDPVEVTDTKLIYFPIPRIGLKRFIFLDKSKLENRFKADEEAYSLFLESLNEKISVNSYNFNSEDVVSVIQDLLYGFNAVVRNRSWFVQSLFPVCPELTFCESMGYKKHRATLDFYEDQDVIDSKFDFNGHYFMARGGEVYFLHVLKGLAIRPELKTPIEDGLNRLIGNFPEFSQLANWLQNNWEEQVSPQKKVIEKSCEWIPDGYTRRSPLTCLELSNLLASNLHPLKMMEILSFGIVLQILRMMHEQAFSALHLEKGSIPTWVMDMTINSNLNIKKKSVTSYQSCEEALTQVLYLYLPNEGEGTAQSKADRKSINDGMKNAHKLFRKLGKEIGLVIPPKGPNMRFSLSENLVKFLVLSLISPGEKMTFTSFLNKLFEHFYILIGPEQTIRNNDSDTSGSYFIDFDMNQLAFQEILKKCGFLRDLSDATAIVENPYERFVKNEAIL